MIETFKPVDVLDIKKIRADFPILEHEIRPGLRVTYLDSTATTQKPSQVIDAMDMYYRQSNANIHRGIHHLAEEATTLYEDARAKIGAFVNAPDPKQIIFTRNTTESINLVAQTWGRKNLQAGDLIILTEMEHHSNLVPWQLLASEKDLRLEFIPVDYQGLLDLDEYRRLLDQNPKLVAFTHMSNVLGTINPVKAMTTEAHSAGATVLIDGAQSVPHFSVDIQELGADFLVFSGHKMCGPTGVGVLYGKKELLEEMPPFLGGGDMIKKVELRTFKANTIPHKFEAGTPAIAEAIGLGAAVDYLLEVGMDEIAAQEQVVVNYAIERLSEVPGVTVYGPEGSERGGVTSFNMEGVHAHDVAQILDGDGIAVRAGHHCAMPLHDKLGIPASTRASYYLYNSVEDVDKLITSLYRVKEIFRI
jgi:cysteine desulfurase/selenocysteine lyase